VDALWAPFAGTGKILASFFRNTAHTSAMTVGGAATDRRGCARAQGRTTIDRGERERMDDAVRVSRTAAVECEHPTRATGGLPWGAAFFC
jgi:hypothetical protein